MDSSTHILFAILNWGLGHATRSIPIISELLRQGARVTLATEGNALAFIRKHFPELNFVQIPGYSIDYPKSNGSFELHFLKKAPQLIKELRQEQEITQFWVNEIKPDAIISDNRYGVFNRAIPSAIITHQLQFKGSIFSSIASRIIQSRLRSFDQIWVPDEDHQLSGEISKSRLPTLDIGSLSTMKKLELPTKRSIGVVLSGLEPQRSDLESVLFPMLKDSNFSFHLVRGIFGSDHQLAHSTNFMGRDELNRFMCESEFIICRSGYSTIMDLAAIQKPAIVVPTAGQPEQEYLARYVDAKGYALHRTSDTINLEEDLSSIADLKPWPKANSNSLLQERVKNFLDLARK